MTSHNLNQPIVLDRTGEHTTLVHAAALASLGVFLGSLIAGTVAPTWSPWIADTWTKVSRRAKPNVIAAVAAEHPGTSLRIDGALAMVPMTVTDQPTQVATAQVADTDMPRTTTTAGSAGPVEILVLDALTTGKAAAQALWGWAKPSLMDSPEPLLEWWSGGHPLLLRLVDRQALAETAAADTGVVQVHDAGRSEVPPGTLTAVAASKAQASR